MADGNPPDPKGTIEFLWKVIGRFDTYVGSTNTKAGLLATFDTFVLGTIALKWKEVVVALDGHPKLVGCVAVLALLAAAATLVSLAFALLAIHPFLFSPKTPEGDYHSLIFFGDVRARATGEEYRTAVAGATEAAMIRDLCYQAHAVAKGLTPKMTRLQVAVGATIAALAALVGVVACLFVGWVR